MSARIDDDILEICRVADLQIIALAQAVRDARQERDEARAMVAELVGRELEQRQRAERLVTTGTALADSADVPGVLSPCWCVRTDPRPCGACVVEQRVVAWTAAVDGAGGAQPAPDLAGALDRAGDALERLLTERGQTTTAEPRGEG